MLAFFLDVSCRHINTENQGFKKLIGLYCIHVPKKLPMS